MSSYTQKVYDIYYEAETGLVIMNWKGYATSQQFRDGTEIMLNTLIANKASKVLADIQDMLVIGMEDQEWLQTIFLPRAINFGFRAIAMVKPKSYFNKVAVEAVSYKVDKEKLSINFFDTTEEAREWLSGR
jgi:hypothetical protein